MLTLLAALLVLTIAAEILVRTASALSLQLGLSPLFVGLTIVGFGTSSPELAASVSATLNGLPSVSVSNVLGSNIFNIAAILGLTALLCPIPISLDELRSDLKVAIVAVPVPLLSYLAGATFERAIGVGALLALTIYLYRAFLRNKSHEAPAEIALIAETQRTLLIKTKPSISPMRIVSQLIVIVVSLGLLIISADKFVTAASELARGIGVSDRVIGLTIVAAGTSLPELVTSLVATLRASPAIAVGNVIGSCIFNLLGIFGIASLLGPQSIPWQSAWIDVPILFFLTVLLLPLIKTGSVITRGEGLVLVGIYIGYSGVVLALG